MDWRQLGFILSQLDFRLAAAGSSLTLLLIAGLATRWQIFLRQQGITLRFSTIFGLTWAGQFFNSVLPGSTGGDVVKIYQLCRLQPDRKAAAAATVFADRLSALVALLLLAGTAFVLKPVPVQLLHAQGFTPTAVALVAVGVAVLGLAALVLAIRFLRGTQLLGRIARTLAAAKKAPTFSFDSFATICLAFVLHLLNFLIVYLFARSLALNISYAQTLLIMPVVLLLVMLPLTINGHGLRELLLVAYFSAMGIGLAIASTARVQEVVVALSVLVVSNDLLWSLPGGLWYLARSARRKVRRASS